MLKGMGCLLQLGSVNTFGRTPVDQAIEETANRDTLNTWGNIGI